MTYLLDTHVWLWLVAEDELVRSDIRHALADPGADVRLSVASAWEISIKHATGKLRLSSSPPDFVPRHLAAQGTQLAHVELEHVLRVAELPPHHRDPFDRLLVAQAQLLDATIVTADASIARYDVDVIDPR